MTTTPDLSQLSPEQLRRLAAELMTRVEQQDEVIKRTELRNQQLTHELALLKRHKYGQRSEQLNVLQISLLDEVVDADIAAIEVELEQLSTATTQPEKRRPKRAPLPPELPRTEIRHEPASEHCTCGCQLKRIGEDVSEKLDYTPGVFTVERHIRGKWACARCETLTQAPMPAHIIDKGIPTTGLLAQVLIAKYADHLPLYRQEQIFAHAGVAIPRSTLAEWIGICGVQVQPLVDALRDRLLDEGVLHADETPVPMLAPGKKKKTHKAQIWAYTSTPFSDLEAVVYDFTPGRAGRHAREFLGDWKGQLVCDDYSGYKAGFDKGIIEIGCLAHARRKFVELHIAGKSQIAGQAVEYIKQLYKVEHEARDLTADERQRLRQDRSQPIAEALYNWMQTQRLKVPEGTAIANALDYSLKRWAALTRYLDDGAIPIDNNRVENLIRPWALGRKNWLFAGSLRSGRRAAAIMSLIQSARLNGHEPYAYLKDVLARLPTQKASAIDELLPHNWQPATADKA